MSSSINDIKLGNISLAIPSAASVKKNLKNLSNSAETTHEVTPADSVYGSGFAFSGVSPVTSPMTQRSNPIEALSAGDNSTIDIIDQGDEDLDFPEGGLKSYMVCFGSFMGLIPAFGMVNSVGTIQAYVSTHQLANISTSTVSWIFSMYTFIAFASQIFAGTFFDRQGALKPLLIGSVAFCGGLFATANCTTVYQFILSFGVVTGFGNGMMIPPLVGVVSHYFNKKRATASSIATTGGSVGGIVIPLLLRKLYASVGFQWALRVLGFVCLVCCIFSLIFAKERIRQDGEKVDSFKKLFKVYVVDVFDYKAIWEPKFIFCSLGVSLAESSLVVSAIYYPSYAIARGFSENQAYLLVIVVNSTGILGRYIPGYVADKFLGRFNVCIITIFAGAAVSLIMWLPFGYNLQVLYAYSALYGFCSGSILSLSPVCCGQISRTEEFGKRYSTMYMFVSVCMLATIPIGGAIIGDGEIKDYNNFILFSSLIAAAGATCYAISRYFCVGLRLCKF